jgi:NAD(P)H-hydrate repair Nnr-like enzyme with NAD(P)H-hydrate epimerase domain
MKKTCLRFIMFLTVALLLPAALFAQKKESLAIFAFTGGNASDGEAVASSLSRQATLRNAFNKTTMITRTTIAAMNFEQRFQRSGLTDADTIFKLGKALNASHVIAGYITRLGSNNLVLVSIMDY